MSKPTSNEDKRFRHGGKRLPEYNVWCLMKRRCINPKDKQFKDYGGRGITVCERWANDFGAFFEDMGPRPERASLDRINNNGNYEPSNCRCATKLEQANNARNNRFVEYQGEKKTLAQWATLAGISKTTFWRRINTGWSIEKALTHPTNLYHNGRASNGR